MCFDKKVYNLFTRDIKTGQDHLNPKLPKEIKNALGQRAEKIIAEDRDTIQEQRQRLEEAKKQLREAKTIAAEREKELLVMENLKQQTDKVQGKIDAIQEEHESETELRRLKQLKKNYKTDFEDKWPRLKNKPKTNK